jgi:hypothetical protein
MVCLRLSAMTFEQWKARLGRELVLTYGMTADVAAKEIARTADTIWRRMFDAGIEPDFDPLLGAHWPAFNRWFARQAHAWKARRNGNDFVSVDGKRRRA